MEKLRCGNSPSSSTNKDINPGEDLCMLPARLQFQRDLKTHSTLYSLAPSPDGKFLVAGLGEGTLELLTLNLQVNLIDELLFVTQLDKKADFSQVNVI